MLFPIQAQLGAMETASDRRFRMWELDSQRKEFDREIQAQSAEWDVQFEAQKKIIDLQTASMDALSETTKIANDLAEQALEFARTQSETQTTSIEEVKQALEQLATITQQMATALADIYAWYTARLNTAGGWCDVGIKLESYPIPTGTFMWTMNSVPAGWAECSGGELRIDENLNLYNVFRDAFGYSTDPAMFMLPDADHCPGYIAGLPSGMRCIVRL